MPISWAVRCFADLIDLDQVRVGDPQGIGGPAAAGTAATTRGRTITT
jgi:hypothetical protein